MKLQCAIGPAERKRGEGMEPGLLFHSLYSKWLFSHPHCKNFLFASLPWFCSAVKESTCQCRRPRFNPWVRKIRWRRDRLPTPVFLPGKSNGQRSLAGFCDRKVTESDTNEKLNHNLNLAGVCIYFPEDISGFFGEHQQCILSFCGGFIF